MLEFEGLHLDRATIMASGTTDQFAMSCLFSILVCPGIIELFPTDIRSVKREWWTESGRRISLARSSDPVQDAPRYVASAQALDDPHPIHSGLFQKPERAGAR